MPGFAFILQQLNKISDDDGKRSYLRDVEPEVLITTILHLLSNTKLNTSVDTPPNKPATINSPDEKTFLDLMEDQKRRCSVVISGLPESDKTTASEKLADDNSRVRAFLDLFGISSFETSFRMGSLTEGKNRLIKVILNSIEAQKHLLQNAFVLKNATDFRGVYVRESLSKSQRVLYRKLLQLRRSLLTENPSRKLYIRNLKLIDGHKRQIVAKVAPDSMSIVHVENQPSANSSINTLPNDMYVNKNPRRKRVTGQTPNDTLQALREEN